MAVLKKIRSATLVEAMVATVLIVVVFMIASLVMNNLLLNTFSRNTHAIDSRMKELEYNIKNENIETPYSEEYNGWRISIDKTADEQGIVWLNHKAVNLQNGKEVTNSTVYEAN